MAAQTLTIALAGNPNVGKSTLFNALTGSRQHVGNWPGKTVEKKEGFFQLGGWNTQVVDLPGTYSLAAFSVEERIARDYVIQEHPDVVVAVVDASNLERNLYLVTQFIELEMPLILVLNMSDMAHNRGIRIDPKQLSVALGGTPVVETVGSRGTGLEALKATLERVIKQGQSAPAVQLDYGEELEAELSRLEAEIASVGALAEQGKPRWLALKLLENDAEVVAAVRKMGCSSLLDAASEMIDRITESSGEDPETLITSARYSFVARTVSGAVTRPETFMRTRSDRVDSIVTHKIWGLPIFLAMMWLVFQLTANVSAPYLDWTDSLINGPLARGIQALLMLFGLHGTWVESLVIDGIVAGVGGVLVFVPVLLFLYTAIAVLEDSGYMARAAFVMDRLMRSIGLNGKSFLPLLIGFGCTVPAVYATRTLEHENDRKLTAFIATFMSCGARLPVYAIFGAAFFGAAAGNLVFGLYILGILIALATGVVAKRTIYRNAPPQPFVLELPPYRMPTPRNLVTHVWERTSGFVRKAATVILSCSIAIWLLMAIPTHAGVGEFNAVAPEDSLFGTVSQVVAPVFAPAGFGNWQSAGALLTGFLAKEVIIGSMSQIYVGGSEAIASEDENLPTLGEEISGIVTSFAQATVLTAQEFINIIPRTINLIPVFSVPEAQFLPATEEEEDTGPLSQALMNSFTPLAAVAFNVFVLLYVPCMAATTAMRHEFGTRMMAYQLAYTIVIAWVAAVLVYQIGSLLGIGTA